MGLDKKEETQIWETMMARRRRLGPDPDDHPSVRRRMEHEFVAILLVINWILAKLSVRPDGTYQAPSKRQPNATHILLTFIIILLIGSTALTWLAYQQNLIRNSRQEIYRSRAEYLGRALLKHSKITIEQDNVDFIISYKRTSEESLDDSIRIPHNIPGEELKRIEPK